MLASTVRHMQFVHPRPSHLDQCDSCHSRGPTSISPFRSRILSSDSLPPGPPPFTTVPNTVRTVLHCFNSLAGTADPMISTSSRCCTPDGTWSHLYSVLSRRNSRARSCAFLHSSIVFFLRTSSSAVAQCLISFLISNAIFGTIQGPGLTSTLAVITTVAILQSTRLLVFTVVGMSAERPRGANSDLHEPLSSDSAICSKSRSALS